MENDVSNRVVIRPVQLRDAETVAVLSASLGYPVAEDDIRSRIEQLADDNERMAFPAVLEGEVVGWVDAAVERHLQSAAVVAIGGLVVRDDMRGRRVGQQLCLAIEQWADHIENHHSSREITKRTDAHRFYLRGGYTQVKTSAVYASVHGTVTDVTGAVVPNAPVTILNTSTGIKTTEAEELLVAVPRLALGENRSGSDV